MVLGMKTNSTRRSTMLQTEYKIHLKEIKPWPPSQSLNSLRSVLIQWQNGTQISGTTTLIVPTQPSIITEGKIEFNQSFNISISLPRMMSIRSNSFKAFQKNCLEFNLYEPRRDNVKGLLLASASIDFAEYGILKETISANLVMNCKRNFRNVTQPILYIDIEPMKINGLRSSLSMLIDKRNGGDSVLELMSEEYAKEAVVELVAADDDGGGSSHSSLTVSSSAYEFNEDSVDPIDEGNSESAKNDTSLDLNDTPAEVRISKTEQIKSFSDVVRTKLTSVSMDEVLTYDNNNVLPTPYQLNKSVEKAQQDINLEKNGEQETEYVVNITESIATKHVKSVRSFSSFSKNDTSERSYSFAGDTTTPLRNGGERKELRFHSRERSQVIENRIQELEKRVKILETELREAAAIEIAIYSVIADHGKSEIKIHTPARRLSRLYIHAYEENSQASAAKSSVSGLVLVAKACGNDVTRLMYWLSNCVVLRSIITLATGHDELPLSTGVDDEDDEETEKSSSLNDDEDFINMPDWSDPQTYARALEKVESWIFCRIIESLWWQTLVPYMQCYEESFDHIHITSLMNSRIDNSHDKYNFPVELWNEAFKEVSERLCPVRATKHECGCLQMLSQLVIEQCIARLDVSMFNAILRESADEVPTDPVSDPISDVRVLPVPVGKSSFGAGAQLKNATGNWSRSLNELFNLRDREFVEDETERNDGDERQQDTCTKFFYHLNTLSDLMMLPKDLLLDKSVRKEVCPTLGSQLIKRLLNFHVPDEFCTDLVPVSLLESLDREDFDEFGEECISHVPCAASPPLYLPPVADSLECIIGNLKIPELKNSDLLLIRKAYTSDDEIDELQSPLSYMLMDGSGGNSSRRSVKEDGGALRYQLLKEVWRSSH